MLRSIPALHRFFAVFTALLCAGFLTSYQSRAQNASQYSFSPISGTYTYLTGGTGVSNIQVDDATSAAIPLGFSFEYCGTSYTTIKACSNGWFSFGQTFSATTYNDQSELASIVPALMPLWEDISGVNGTASYLTTGTAPNRIFTFECKNWRWNYGATSAAISFQLKLYETTNVIDFQYQQEAGAIVTWSGGATIGISRTSADWQTLDATSTSPTASPLTFTTTLLTKPANGQIYRWTPPPPCTGTPVAGTVVPGPVISTCPNGAPALTTTGTTVATGLAYQWEVSTNGGTTWGNATGGTGATTIYFTPPAVTTSGIQYRLKVTCTNTGGTTVTSAPVTINVTPPGYAPVPYVQDFENWMSYCSNSDAPDTNWVNSPSIGNEAWRREDQGPATAGWSNPWGDYFPSSYSGNHSARWHSYDAQMNNGGNLDMYLNCSATTGNKQLYFYFINQWADGDSLEVFLSTNGGTSFTQLLSLDTAMDWRKISLPIASNSAQTVIRFRGAKWSWDYSDIGIDSVYVAPPCSGTPVAGFISAPASTCPGASLLLSASGTTMAGNLSFQWESSATGAAPWTAIAGATNPTFQTPPLSDTIYYRLKVTCGGSAQFAYTNTAGIMVAAPGYATLPYVQGFENWASRCDFDEVPDSNWTNTPATGEASWRRDDQGASANWGWTAGGLYSPASILGSHSARFHSYSNNEYGNIDLYVNASAPGTKELQFYFMSKTPTWWDMDSLYVRMSTDNGATFTTQGSYDISANDNWELKTLSLATTSAQTVIRFSGKGAWGYDSDLGIDEVKVLLPCSGKPTAGNVTPATPCSGQPFNLSLTGTSQAGGLTFLWQESANGTAWTNVAGGTMAISSATITAPTYFRCIVTCSNGNLADTSAPLLLNLASFYYCYCQSSAMYNYDDDIGNVSLLTQPAGDTLLNNGIDLPSSSNSTATNVYTNFTNLTLPTLLYRDSVYKMTVSQINEYSYSGACAIAAWIDYNQNGSFDPNEQVFGQNTNYYYNDMAPDPNIKQQNFTVPSTAPVGITGMRVVMNQGGSPQPCSSTGYYAGETEDYLVNIQYQPCLGTPDAGLARISDTLICPVDTVTLIDTTHTRFRSGLTWVWERTTDSTGQTGWATIAGSLDKDTVKVMANGTTYYRLKIVCSFSNDSAYSNKLKLKIKAPYKCYCYSFANGGTGDVSDAGAFTIGTFVTNTGGAHLNNVTAVKKYTDWTDVATANLFRDSVYEVSAYHVMKSSTHADAKVTLFIDFNNNWQYDIPSERVWTAYTSASSPYVTGYVTIPNNVVLNTVTGMRLVVNENINPNVPSDEACGPYTSGETEDYIVKFKPKFSTGIGRNGTLLQEASLYPNPTTGKFTVWLSAGKSLKDLQVIVTDLTGRTVQQKDLHNTGLTVTTELDMSGQPRGVYLVELRADGDRLVRKLVVR